MTEDGWLIVLVSAIWAALAAAYALVPMLDMPGSALLWGSGAVIFAGLAALIIRAETKAR
jgi:hypothetical protein